MGCESTPSADGRGTYQEAADGGRAVSERQRGGGARDGDFFERIAWVFSLFVLNSFDSEGILKNVAASFDGDVPFPTDCSVQISEGVRTMGDARDIAKKKKADEKKGKTGKGAPAKSDAKAPKK